MKDLLLLQEVRFKENKTDVEELLLKYSHSLVYISEILISESKQHISNKEALNKIRSEIDNIF